MLLVVVVMVFDWTCCICEARSQTESMRVRAKATGSENDCVREAGVTVYVATNGEGQGFV